MQKLEYSKDEIVRTIMQVDEAGGIPAVSKDYVTVRLSGKRAMFEEPSCGIDKRTYPIPPFSAVRKILEAIYRNPGMNWVPVFCGIRKPIQIVSAQPENTKKSADGSMEYLLDVEYYIKAYIVSRPNFMQTEDDLMKFNDAARENIRTGQYIEKPFLGTNKCPCKFGTIDPNEWNNPELFQDITMDLGYVTFDFDSSGKNGTPLLKPMIIQKGKVFYLKGEILHPKGGSENR